MVRRFAWALGVILPVVIGLYSIPRGDLLVLIAASIGLAFVIAAATARPIQQRLGLVRTPAIRFRKVHDDFNVLRAPLMDFLYGNGPALTRAEWEPKVIAWDAEFWKMIDDVFYARGASLRASTYQVFELTRQEYRADKGWAAFALRFLDQRGETLDGLVKEIPGL